MKFIKGFFKLIVLIAIIGGMVILLVKFEKKDKKVEVIKWDNLYNGNNIEFFYTGNDKRVDVLSSTYGINKLVEGIEDEHGRALKIVDMINSIVQYDDVEDKPYFNAYDILSNIEEGKKVSGRDLAIIARDFLTAMGFEARVGNFRRGEGLFNREKNYYVVEYWNNTYNKWVMVDILDKGYFVNLGVPCSAIEISVLETNKINYIGNKVKKEYLKEKKRLFNSYTVAIDNTLDMKKSNSYITFIKNNKDIELVYNNKYLPPTIFTSEIELFNKKPNESINKDDNGINIVLMKKDGDNDNFIIGGYNNGKIVENYYIKVNNLEYELVNSYKDLETKIGKNTVEISLDGNSSYAIIEFIFNKK